MAEFKRAARVSEGIREELSAIIQDGALRDPDVGFITITDVVATDDLRQARVFVSVYGDAPVQTKTIAALGRAAAFLRRELGARLRLRFTPELEFSLDTSLEKGARIDSLLKKIERGQSPDELDAPAPAALPVSTPRGTAPVVEPPPATERRPAGPRKGARDRRRGRR